MKTCALLMTLILISSCQKSENKKTIDYLNTDYLKDWTYVKEGNKESWTHPTADITFSAESVSHKYVLKDKSSASKIAEGILENKIRKLEETITEKIDPSHSPDTFSKSKYKHDYIYWIGQRRCTGGFIYLFKEKYILLALDVDKTQKTGFSSVMFWYSIDVSL